MTTPPAPFSTLPSGDGPCLTFSPAPCEATLFGLIRHAPTLWNEQKRIQGRGDSPLTADGIARARRWGHLLKPYGWDRLLSSNQTRARHTADLVNEVLNLPVVHDPLLCEQNWGDWEGMAIADIFREKAAELEHLLAAGWGFRPPGGESREEVWARGLHALRATAATAPGAKVLVVTHGGMIRVLTYRLLDRRFDPAERALVEKRHLHLIRATNGSLSVDRINALRLG